MPSAALLARASSGELEKAAETIAADVLADTTEETKSPVTPSRARTYQVRSGDTLSAIARKTGTTIAQLKNWNKLRTTNLKVGTQLLDPVAAQPRTNTAKRQHVSDSSLRRGLVSAAISAIFCRSRFAGWTGQSAA